MMSEHEIERRGWRRKVSMINDSPEWCGSPGRDGEPKLIRLRVVWIKLACAGEAEVGGDLLLLVVVLRAVQPAGQVNGSICGIRATNKHASLLKTRRPFQLKHNNHHHWSSLIPR